MMILTMVMALAAAAPSAEAEALGQRIARTGTLGAMLPQATEAETQQMIAAHPELTDAERATLRETGVEVTESALARLTKALGTAYAQILSVEDMEAIAAFNESPAASAYRKAQPVATASAMKSLGGLDFKGELTAAFCKKTGKLCAAPKGNPNGR
ncbi:DUF2059 domain-containing protein [Sphingomonas naphthae]|uniref:DUF2059 domain-containing protein n=1 Tax=Sphingomonas naphthae TaxID=1813468 RepID=A0ABY7TLX0_9SPHN|nr:DUF2059 domain-containing protein [Sphingomonas naphthae]WCT72834.1 DUF2059 domain-containing protein [Sphingomonas naphthae]